ncbi:hypothetical protein ACRALDRAFT_1028029 [Sodiomyces alcalophilus JCM 7366]|uniref:uncharacterized protein n=1 Tax=Sodiomyces alcalophilus JCM 7366 TaxID=591952 RepID=UPI0039B4B87D
MQEFMAGRNTARPGEPPSRIEQDGKLIFKPLENYIISCFGSFNCVNNSFLTNRSTHSASIPRPTTARRPSAATRQEPPNMSSQVCDLDPKLLLLGDFAENGMWWTGVQGDSLPQGKSERRRPSVTTPSIVTSHSPRVDWAQVSDWYAAVVNAAETWPFIYDELCAEEHFESLQASELRDLEASLLAAQDHLQRVLLKATETLLKRPGRLMTDPSDVRFLLIIMHNPLLHDNFAGFSGILQSDDSSTRQRNASARGTRQPSKRGPVSGQHSSIIKRVVGLMSNASSTCQTHLVAWFASYSESAFASTKDLVGGFLTYRLIRQRDKKHETRVDITDGLIPNMSNGHSAASLHAALGTPSASRKPKETPKKVVYRDDWQIRAAARVMALLFAANNTLDVRRADASALSDSSVILRQGVQTYGQLLPTSDFYNSMIDYADLVADFEAWESKRAKFSFCQYPFLLSIWAKSKILEYDAQRQMTNKARDAFFDSIMTRKNVNQFLTLDVRRDCLVEDSLAAVSEVIGSGSEDIKKRLRIVFKGEEGYDAGGLRKEWFLLLVREVFNPDHGMFVYDEDSHLCYFNPNSFETSDQFFLVGVVLGLAIYNSTILDVALPPFAYRKLLASAPSYSSSSSAHPRPSMTYNLEDLAEYRPRLAAGLKQLLDYEEEVEDVFGLEFVVPVERYGTVAQVPLCSGGETRSVTNTNRKDYVDLYVRYILETAVARQFEPFKRGFYTVCGGNALSLFRPEEIELLVRGSDAPLDIKSLRAVAEYDNWGTKNPDGAEPVVGWFWETFERASPKEQRRLLLFITGSDRIPAMGASLLPIKISCLGEDEGRYPIARTCFNMLALRRYGSRERLEQMLWTAVHESEGFGLK